MDEVVAATFEVGGLPFALLLVPVTRLDGYTEEQLGYLEKARAFLVSFRLDSYVAPDGAVVSGYHVTGTGHAFQVLGGVANALFDWVTEHKPDYLLWHAVETNRQRLYDRMVRLFRTRGSGYLRLPCDPFTGRKDPGEFWLGREDRI